MGHTLSGYSALGAEALREQPFIMLAQGSPFRFKVERMFRRTRVQPHITRWFVEQPCVELQPGDRRSDSVSLLVPVAAQRL